MWSPVYWHVDGDILGRFGLIDCRLPLNSRIFYYACGLRESRIGYIPRSSTMIIVSKVFSAVNVLFPILLSDGYSVSFSLEGLQIFVLAILATRMHLYLWHTELHVDDSEALVYISMSDMSPANCTP